MIIQILIVCLILIGICAIQDITWILKKWKEKKKQK